MLQVHRQSSRCQQMLQVPLTVRLNFSTSPNQTTNKQSWNTFHPRVSAALLLPFINHSLIPTSRQRLFHRFSSALSHIVPSIFLLFCVIKFEQRKVDCLSELQNRSIILLSRSHTADKAQWLARDGRQRNSERQFWTCRTLLSHKNLFMCFDLVFLPLELG